MHVCLCSDKESSTLNTDCNTIATEKQGTPLLFVSKGKISNITKKSIFSDPPSQISTNPILLQVHIWYIKEVKCLIQGQLNREVANKKINTHLCDIIKAFPTMTKVTSIYL